MNQLAIAVLCFGAIVGGVFGKCNLDSAKKVVFTNYWVAVEGTTDYDDDGKEISLTGPNNVALKSCKGGQTLVMTNKNLAYKCSLEGTCKLANGRIFNVGDSMKCFEELDSKKYPWGLGSNDNALVPMVSVAVNGLKVGTKLKIQELVGKKLPNGKTHNGCVRVDDTCSTCKEECHLDFLVGKVDYYRKMNTPDKVTAVVANDCKIQNYGI